MLMLQKNYNKLHNLNIVYHCIIALLHCKCCLNLTQ